MKMHITELKTTNKIGKVFIQKIPSGLSIEKLLRLCINEKRFKHSISNLVTNESAEMFAGWLAGEEAYKFTHMYGQWGDSATYPENGGPFFTPQRDDQVADLDTGSISTVDARVPIIHKFTSTQPGQSEFSNNIISSIGIFTGNTGKSYIGVGLVCELPTNRKLLLAHVALDGIIMESGYDILIMWDWIFSNI